MKDKQRNGYGITLWHNGDKHDGYWLDNEAHGQGKFFFNSGAVYEGEWAANKAEGYGIYQNPDGYKY